MLRFVSLGVLGTAVAGVVAGHTLTYFLLFGDGQSRHEVLARTGHGYWELAVAAAAVLSLFSAGATMVRHFRGGRSCTTPAGLSLLGFILRLVPLQIGLFLALEVGERIATGGLHLSLHRLAWVGTLIQAAVALGLALLLRALAGLARAAGRAFATATAVSSRALARIALHTLHVVTPLLDGARSLRGPPVALVPRP